MEMNKKAEEDFSRVFNTASGVVNLIQSIEAALDQFDGKFIWYFVKMDRIGCPPFSENCELFVVVSVDYESSSNLPEIHLEDVDFSDSDDDDGEKKGQTDANAPADKEQSKDSPVDDELNKV